MAQINIYGDIDSGSMFFLNSTVDPKALGTIEATLKSDEDRIVIRRTDRFEADGVTFRTLFKRLNPRRVSNRDGEELVDQLGYTTQQVIDYVNEQNALTGSTGGDGNGVDVNAETICFTLDDTSTSVIMDNGYSFGVNTIKAVDVDGCIQIQSIQGGRPLFTKLVHTNTCINDAPVAGGLNDVINALNELFTVGPFQSVVITDPEAVVIADVAGVDDGGTNVGDNAIVPVGDDILGTTATHNNKAGYLSANTINQAGEYFTFDIAGKATYGFGLVHTQASFDDGFYSGSATYADPAGFCDGVNSSHYGYQFAHHFHIGNAHASWTNYGANTSYVMGEAWYDHANRFDLKDEWNAGDPVKVKVGISELGFITISTLHDDGINWRLHARSAYPVPAGSEFKLGIKLQTTGARLRTAPKVHLREEEATDPTTLGDTSITVFGEGITGTLAGGISSSATDNFDNDGFVTTETISSIGEYFELDWSSGGDFNFGLFSENNHDVADLGADTTSWPASKFIFYGAEGRDGGGVQGVRTDQGLGYTTIGDGSTADYKARVGFDASGKPTVWGSADGGTTWFVFHKANASAPVGDYRFIFVAEEAGVVFDGLTKGTQSFAPTMSYRFIESPDGTFQYPLFATEEEANYYDTEAGGSGTSHTHVYADDPTSTTWYMPTTNAVHNGTSAPVADLTTGAPGTYTEITSLTNSALVPPAFTDTTITVDELSAVNYQVSPMDVDYATTIGGIPAFSMSGNAVVGTAPEVTGDNVANPSDTTTVTVYRTNSYGTSQGTLTINITNLTAPVVTPIAGVTHEGGTPLIDSDTMDDGSVISIDNVIDNGNRFVIDKEWLDNYVLPKITSGSGSKSVWVGFAPQGTTANWTDIANVDFRIAYEFNCDDASRANNNFRLKTHIQGSSFANVGVGSLTNGLYDFVLINDGATLRGGALVASAGHNASTKVFDANNADWNWTIYNSSSVGNQDIVIATVGTDMDIDLQYFNEYTEPTPPVTNLTDWNKALDFSGSSERAQMVSTSSNFLPLAMDGLSANAAGNANSGYTSNNIYSRPWMISTVFKVDGHSSNQHIWNQGGGANDDNVYLRLSASRGLYFGWGRDGVGVNECYLGMLDTSLWYGVAIAHTGERLSGSDATAANLAGCFDIRLTSSYSVNQFTIIGSNKSTQTNWQSGSTGQRMDRNMAGSFTIGGRGTNRSFHGKVASMVVTTLRTNVLMPDSTELDMVTTDPIKWLQDYKVGEYFRYSFSQSANNLFELSNTANVSSTSAGLATQVWLMGDGSNDSYSNMIRNRVNPGDQNYSKLNLISMVSNDIQTVTIPGLS